MEIKSRAVFVLIQKQFSGNMADFCRALGLSYTTLWRVLNKHSSGVSKFIPALSGYCKANNLKLSDYVKF